MNLIFKFDPPTYFWFFRNGYNYDKFVRFEANKYDIIMRPNITEFQIKNVTTNDTGLYWVVKVDSGNTIQLSISSMYIVTLCSFCIRQLSVVESIC